MHNALSLRSVVAVARAYAKLSSDPRYLANKDLAALRTMERASAHSLAVISRSGLDPDVRLSADKVRSMCWALLKAAKAELRKRAALQWDHSECIAAGECDCGDVPDVRDAELGAGRRAEVAEAQATEYAAEVEASLRERLVLALDVLAEREAIGADAWEERADVAYFRARLAQVAPYYPDPCFYCGGAVKVGAQCDC